MLEEENIEGVCMECGGLLVCSRCKDAYGLVGAIAMAKANPVTSKAEMAEHLEDFHGFIIRRPFEKSMVEAVERCAMKGIQVEHVFCNCEKCRDERWINEARSIEL